MKEVGFMKKATGVIAAAVAVLTVMPASEVQAQTSNTIFPAGWDRSVRDRMFMRLGAIYVNTQTKASDAVDLSGPVFSKRDIDAARVWLAAKPSNYTLEGVVGGAGTTGIAKPNWSGILLGLAVADEFAVGGGLGTPPGIKAKIGDASTMALSLGYWLSDAWMLEAFLLAKPLDVKVYGAGTNQQGRPNGLAGKHIISTKMLPPLAVLSRHFGSPEDIVRPFVGVGATYAVIYDAKTTGFYDSYVGGKTSVSVKNAFGVGPFVGLTSRLNEDWHVSVQVGQVKLKTEATLTTRNTIIGPDSGVINDFSAAFWDPSIQDGILTLGFEAVNGQGNAVGKEINRMLSKLVAASKGQTDLGSFSRKQEQKLRSTIVNISVGYSF